MGLILPASSSELGATALAPPIGMQHNTPRSAATAALRDCDMVMVLDRTLLQRNENERRFFGAQHVVLGLMP